MLVTPSDNHCTAPSMVAGGTMKNSLLAITATFLVTMVVISRYIRGNILEKNLLHAISAVSLAGKQVV